MALEAIRDPRPVAVAPWSDPTVRVTLGVFTLAALFVFWHEFEPSLTFRPVDAVVMGSDVAKVMLTLRYHPHAYYEAEVFFRYEVAGVRYVGTRYRRTDLGPSYADARERASALVRGSKVQAWYNPLRPEEAVLSKAPNIGVLMFAGLILAMMWFGAARKRLRLPPTPAPESTPID